MAVSLHIARNLRGAMTLPVLMKEMRSRMRGGRTQVLLFISTALAILVGLLIVQTQWSSLTANYAYGYSSFRMAEIGRSLFIGLMILEAVLCAIIAPALTAGAISSEREKQTLELLLLTRLSSENIVMGKLLSSLSLLVVVLFCALPVGAICFLFGGVDPWQFVGALSLILSVMCLFGAVGLFVSSRFRQTTTAIVLAYVICVAWVGLLPLASWMLSLWDNSIGSMTDAGWVLMFFLMVGMLLVLAVAPPAIISLLWVLFTRNKPSRLFSLVMWGFSAIGTSLLLYLPGATDMIDPQYLLFGNPVVALAMVLKLWGFDPSSYLYSSTYPMGTSLVTLIVVPCTVVLHFLAALVFKGAAVREVERMRS